MHAARTLPAGFVLGGTLTLAGNRRLRTRLNLLSVPWLVVSFPVCMLLAALVRPDGWQFSPAAISLPAFLAVLIGGLIAMVAVTIVVHEAAHGLVMWAFTRSLPVFGFRGWYFYTDAPGWYLSRAAMLAALVAPLVLVPLVALPVIALAPAGLSLFVAFGMGVNAVIAIGDVYMTVLTLRIRGPVVFGDAPGADTGEAGGWYVPGPVTAGPVPTDPAPTGPVPAGPATA